MANARLSRFHGEVAGSPRQLDSGEQQVTNSVPVRGAVKPKSSLSDLVRLLLARTSLSTWAGQARGVLAP